jgi:Mg2+/citrate symporter
MPLILIFLGIVLSWAGIKNTHKELWKLTTEDLHGYAFWVIAIILVGSLGYVKTLRPLSVAFLTLLMVALLLNNPNVWQQLERLTNSFRSLAPASAGLKPLQPLTPGIGQ